MSSVSGALPELRAEIDATEALTEHIRSVMDRLVARDIERGAAIYIRERHLAPLIGDWRGITDAQIVERLQIKISAESSRLRDSDWCSDLNRLIALKQALAGERRR